jgi:heptosyltransferase-2
MSKSSIQHPVSSIKNILIFSFSHIGDAVLSTAVLSPLQKHLPDARISMLVGPKAEEMFRGDGRLNEIIVYDNRGRHAGLSGKIRLIRELQCREFDLSIDLRDSLWSRFAAGARWGAALPRRVRTDYKESHAVERYLDILSSHGVDSEGAAPELQLLPSEQRLAADFLRQNGISSQDLVIGIHPGGGWQYKLWPIERFAALGDLLSQNYGAKVLVFAGPDETSLQDHIAELMQSPPILVKDVGLRGLAALIQRCALYAGNDTGPMHIAAAVGTRVVAIFGSTSARRSGPYGREHIVISKAIGCNPCHPGRHPGRCKLGKCLAMEAVSIGEVSQVVERILSNGQQ